MNTRLFQLRGNLLILLALLILGAGCPTSPNSTVAEVSVKDLGAAPIRINAGGPSFVDFNGNTWLADVNYNTGSTYSVTDPIAGSVDGQPYQSERWDKPTGSELMYTVPLDPGDYLVRLHFAEIWHGTADPGDRIFDVLIEGQLVLDDYDIVVAAGGYQTAVAEEFTTTVSDGALNVQLLHVFENPKIGGLEVIPLPSTSPALDASPASLTYGSIQVGAASAGQTITMANNGDAVLNVSNIAVQGTNNLDFTTDAAASYAIDPGLSAAFDVTFGPTGAGARSANLVITSDDANSPATIPLSGTGLSPVASLSLSSIDFGSVFTGDTSAATTVTIMNDGNQTLDISSIGLGGSHAGDFGTTAAASYSIAPAASESFDVTFAPSATGARTADLSIVSNDPASPATVALSGTGVVPQPPTADVAPVAIDFGTQTVNTTSGPQSVMITNAGDQTLNVTNVAVSGDFGSDALSSYSIAPGNFVSFNVTFTPTGEGAAAGQVDITSNDPGGIATVLLSGQGQQPQPPTAVLNPATNDFGTVLMPQSSSPLAVTLSNTGDETLEVSSVGIGGANAGDFSTDALTSYSIPAGQSVGFNVTFTPTATGTRSASLSVVSNDPNSPAILALSGTGDLPPQASVTPSSHDFGQVTINESGTVQTFTVENIGIEAYDLTAVFLSGANPGEFTIDGLPTLPLPMNVNDTTTVDVNFAPVTIGAAAADLVIEFDNGAHTAVASLTGLGLDNEPVAFYRLNVGGSAYTDPNGNDWESDSPYANTGNKFSTTDPIAGTELDPVFQTERWDSASGAELQYALPVAPGDYTVRLYFAEIYSGNAQVGKRVFDVEVEGALFLNDFDMMAEAPFLTAIIRETPVTVSDGFLNITLLHDVIENPKLSGIEVLGQVTGAPIASATPTSIDFGQVEVGVESAPQTVTLSNAGQATLQVTSVSIANATGGAFVHDALSSYSIAPSSSVTFDVTLTPDSSGVRTASLEIASNDADSPTIVSLTGEGTTVAAPQFTLSPPSVAFGTADIGSTTAATTVTITNDDTAPHEMHDITITGTDVNDFLITSTPALPVTLAPGASASADVSFAPTATGARSGELRFHFDTHTYHGVAPLSGTGQNPPPPPPTGDGVYRINVGGGSYTDTLGNDWEADNYYNTGSLHSTGNAIAGTSDDTLYKTERWDPPTGAEMMYSLPIANGSYDVRLHFAEIYGGAASVGGRVFDVMVEGQLGLDNYDIFATAGFETAVIESVPVNVTDGTLNIEFLHVAENPKVSAIEVLTAGGLEGDINLIEWGHVSVGATGDLHNVTLTNTGETDVTISSVAFNINQGVGHDFHATLGGTTYAGDHQDVQHPTNVLVPTGQSIVVPVQFLPTEESDNDVNLVFGGNFGPVSVRLIGTGGNDTGHPFLHVVIVTDPYVVDFDGDGSEPVSLVGQFSHTHEIGHSLTAFEWTEGGNLFSTARDLVTNFPVGDHTVTLTIYDDNVPPEVLSGSETFSVVSSSEVPGALARYYPAGGAGGANAYLDAVPATASFAETLPDGFEVLEQSGTIGGSSYATFVMVQMLGTLQIDTTAQYAFQANGGNETRIFVDGNLHTNAQTLTPGLYDVDARFAVDGVSELPLTVTYTIDGGQPMAIDPLLLSHDQSTMPPVINSMPTTGLEIGGATINILGMGFVPTDQVTVHWGTTDLTGGDLTVTPTQITLLSPPGTNTVQITVETPNGVSNPVNYTYNSSGPAPVQFDVSNMVTGLTDPTAGTLGADGRLYVSEIDGTIHAFTFDDNYNVTDTQTITTLEGASNPNILGLETNPFDPPGVVKIYVAHSLLFANGGACFSGFSPYSGQISVLTGPSFSTIEPIATGLPVSNHDHGINGMTFDDNGYLYVAVGGNTNAGVPACNIGDVPESPLSAAILRMNVHQPDFNGAAVYYEAATCAFNDDQVFGNIVNLAHGVDIDVFGAGLRNSFDIEYTTKSLFYATDNGPNSGFGAASTGPNSITSDPSAPDELNIIDVGRYYGSANRNRGREDERQNDYRHTTETTIPGEYEQQITTFSSSTNGIIEYRAQTFNNAMRGDLVAQKWNGTTYHVAMSADGRTVESKTNLVSGFSVLNLVHGPGGVIFGVDYTSGSVMKAVPNDIAAGGLTLYDIHPWRAPATGGKEFVIGGASFGNLGNTTVTIGGNPATVTSVSSKRITGIIPAGTPGPELHDIVVAVGQSLVTMPQAFRYLRTPGTDSGSQAKLTVNPGGNINGSSTYGAGSFQLKNESTNGQKITRMRIDLSTAFTPDVVFDPFGVAGDPVGKDFTHDSGSVGIVSDTWYRPNAGGFDAIEVEFNDFDPGETLGFSCDIDPTNVQGAAQPGPNHSASVSGFDLSSSHVRVEFDDGTVHEGTLFRMPASVTGSEAVVKAGLPPEAEIEVAGLCSPSAVVNANQTVTVYGPQGFDVRLMVVENALYLQGVPNGGFDIDPFEFNTALSVTEYTATIGAGGFVDVPVTLTDSGADAGYNAISAVLVDAQGVTGPVSQTLVFQLN